MEEFQPQAAEGGVAQGGENEQCPGGGNELRMEAEVEEEQSAGAEQDTSSDEVGESSAEQASAPDEADQGVPVLQSSSSRKYPFRQRNPPKTLTYDTLGQPSVLHRHVMFKTESNERQVHSHMLSLMRYQRIRQISS